MDLKSLLLLSTCSLGIFFGTQLTEAILFVPYWKNLSADDFFTLHKIYGKKLHLFYAPLTIIAAILPVVTLIYSLISNAKTDFLLWTMSLFTILFFSSYYLYFKEANTAFANRLISNETLPLELIKWGNWHWGRVICEAIAFTSGLFLLLKMK